MTKLQEQSKENLEKERDRLEAIATCYEQGAEDDKELGYDDWHNSRDLANDYFKRADKITKILKNRKTND